MKSSWPNDVPFRMCVLRFGLLGILGTRKANVKRKSYFVLYYLIEMNEVMNFMGFATSWRHLQFCLVQQARGTQEPPSQTRLVTTLRDSLSR